MTKIPNSKPGIKDNWFDLLGISARYDLNEDELRQHYYLRMSSIHPDRVCPQGEHQVKISQQRASELNQAYRGLLDPLARAVHLLEKIYMVDFASITPKTAILQKAMMWSENTSFDSLITTQRYIILDIAKSLTQEDLECAVDLVLQLKFLKAALKNHALQS